MNCCYCICLNHSLILAFVFNSKILHKMKEGGCAPNTPMLDPVEGYKNRSSYLDDCEEILATS